MPNPDALRNRMLRIKKKLSNNPRLIRINQSPEQLEYLALNLTSICTFGQGNAIVGDAPLCGAAFGTLFII